jgi:hypothetical protein
MEGRTTELISSRSPVSAQFIYCCLYHRQQLFRANLLTGEQSYHQAPAYLFKEYCRWSELSGGSLLITGGLNDDNTTTRDVEKIDTPREYAVSYKPPMHTPRPSHAAVYHSQYLYVLGGYINGRYLSECERYSCAESRWEVLPTLPVACYDMSAVVLDDSLYALGGYARRYLDTVQKLSLDSLTWDLMQLKLPQAAYNFPCFKTDTEVYLVIAKALYSFTPLQVKPVKTLPRSIAWCCSSYYSGGTLYYEKGEGIESLGVGELTKL